MIQAKAIILCMARERTRYLFIPEIDLQSTYCRFRTDVCKYARSYVWKKVVILGSGDIGLIMARRMALGGSRSFSFCVELMPYPNGILQEILFNV